MLARCEFTAITDLNKNEMSTMPNISIRPTRLSDLPDIVAMVKELAVFERAPDAAIATIADFEVALFWRKSFGLCRAGRSEC